MIEKLIELGLSHEEAQIYLELVRRPTTHLRLAHATGINRTKIYRLISDLEKRSLVSQRSDDRGTFLVAADPDTLEVELVTREQQLASQRSTLAVVLAGLRDISAEDGHEFITHTYEGVEGFKQMLWHELKTSGENLVLGAGRIQSLVDDQRWAEKHRAMTLQANYNVREILNPPDKPEKVFTEHSLYLKHYRERYIAPDVVRLAHQTVIYNNTVAIYHWHHEKKAGIEIINKANADMMRQIFEHYWELSKPVSKSA